MASPRKKPVMKEDRAAFAGPPAVERERRAKLARLRKAVIEGEKSGRAIDSSMESILSELDAELGKKR